VAKLSAIAISSALHRAISPLTNFLPLSAAAREFLFRGGGSGRMHFVVQRADGEKLMPARRASKRRQLQEPPQNSGDAFHALRRNTLQFEVAAHSAMRIEERAEWDRPRVESRLAGFAAPRQNSRKTKEIILHPSAFGAPAIRGMAQRTTDQAGVDLVSPHKA